MAITKNDDQVKINSGNNFKVKHNGAWISFGNTVEGTLEKTASKKEIMYSSGYAFDKASKRKGSLMIVLAQNSKEIIDMVDQILSGSKALYLYNGLDDSKHQEIYIPAARCIENLKLEMKGDSHQVIALEFAISPQSGNASVIPNTDMPSDRYASSGSVQTGYNPFFVILETTAA